MEITDFKGISLKNLLADRDILRALFDALNISWFAVDKNGKVIIWNSILKGVVKKLFPNKDLNEVYVKDVDNVAWQHLIHIMQSLTTEVVEEQAPNNRWYLSVKSPLIINKKVQGVIGIAIDITKQKQAEIAKSEFLMNMQHDLRTPFSGILSVSKILHDMEQDAGKKELQKMVVDSADRLLKLLDQVLEISKLGDNPLNYQEFNVNEAANEVAQLLHAEMHTKDLNFSLQCPSAVVKTDRMRFSRILMNLLGNAVKFTEKGAISLRITLEKHLLIEVTDTGIGIPSDKLDFIFEKFAKLKPSNQDQTFSGSGIGLHIVKQFVTELGGLVQVQSQLGQGTTFICKLPLLPIT